jgi:putative ABC transport system permease protein
MVRGARAEDDLQRELDLHLDQLTGQFIADGLSETEARRAAQREFGSLQSTKEQCRDMRRVTIVDDLLKDLVYAVRLLARSPGFTLTAIASLALGIGATTAVFSVVNALLLRPLPFDSPDRLVMLLERNVIGNETLMAVAPGNFLEWQAGSTMFDSISAYTMQFTTMSESAALEPQRIMVCACSGNVFRTLGVTPILGRPFRPEDDRFGAVRTVVISEELWRRRFGGAADIVGRKIRLNDNDYEVIGVVSRAVRFPNRNVEAWVPLLLSLPPAMQVRHDLHSFQVVGRVHAGVPLTRAHAEIDAISSRYKNAHPNESTGKGATLVPLQEAFVADARTQLLVLLAAVSCVLLIACVNIAGLMLTRAAARAREIGIRTALGAGRGRLVRQLVTESVALAVVGGTAGTTMAFWIASLLVARAPAAEYILPSDSVPLDARVFGVALGLTIATGIAVGLIPALRTTRGEWTTDLKETTRSATVGRKQARFRDVLVAAEVALSLVLVVAAGLLLRSFWRLRDVQPGVRIDRTLTLSTTFPASRYRDGATRSAALAQLGDRLRAVPGVASAGLTSCPPLAGACNTLFFYIEGRPFVPGTFYTAHERSVDPQYFAAAGIPLLRGRGLTRADGVGFDAAHPRLGAIVVSDTFAKTLFAGEDPLGKRIFFDYELQRERNEGVPAPRYEIVGVVGDVLPLIDARMTPTLYRPILDTVYANVTMIVHGASDPQALLGAIKEEIRKLDPDLATYQARTLDEQIGRSTSERRFTLLLFASFAALALLLAAIGLYGVVSYGVSQRTAEIGIRMALGATSADVSRLVVRQGLKPAVAGIGAGVVVAVFASKVLRTLLFGVTPADPLTFSLVPPLLLVVAALACYLPAVRATKLDPTIALRTE